MNTKAIVDAIDRALEGTINYTNWDQKIAYLDGLAAICVHVRTNTVILPLAEAYERIVNCRTVFEQAKLKEAKEREAEHERLLTIPEGAEIMDDEDYVFDSVPNELKEEVKVMDAGLDLVPNDAVVVPNPVNTVLDMAREILAPSELRQAMDRTQREQVEPIIYEPTAEALEQIIQQKRDAFVTHTSPSPHEALGEAMFVGMDVQKDGVHFDEVKDGLHKFGVPTPQGMDSPRKESHDLT